MYQHDPRMNRPFDHVEFPHRGEDEDDTCVSSVTGFPAELYPVGGMMYPSVSGLVDVPDNTSIAMRRASGSSRHSRHHRHHHHQANEQPSLALPRPPPPPPFANNTQEQEQQQTQHPPSALHHPASMMMYPSLASIVELPPPLPSSSSNQDASPPQRPKPPSLKEESNRSDNHQESVPDMMRRSELSILKAAQGASPKPTRQTLNMSASARERSLSPKPMRNNLSSSGSLSPLPTRTQTRQQQQQSPRRNNNNFPEQIRQAELDILSKTPSIAPSFATSPTTTSTRSQQQSTSTSRSQQPQPTIVGDDLRRTEAAILKAAGGSSNNGASAVLTIQKGGTTPSHDNNHQRSALRREDEETAPPPPPPPLSPPRSIPPRPNPSPPRSIPPRPPMGFESEQEEGHDEESLSQEDEDYKMALSLQQQEEGLYHNSINNGSASELEASFRSRMEMSFRDNQQQRRENDTSNRDNINNSTRDNTNTLDADISGEEGKANTDPTTSTGSEMDDEEEGENANKNRIKLDDSSTHHHTAREDEDGEVITAVATYAANGNVPAPPITKEAETHITICNRSVRKTYAAIGVVVAIFWFVVILVGGICGAGHCGAGDSSSGDNGRDAQGHAVDGMAGGPVPTPAPTSLRYAAIQSQLTAALGDDYFDGAVGTNDNDSPRSQALSWIVYNDPLQLQPDHVTLLQRFVLAVFYFETSQQHPWSACNAADADQGDYCYYARGLEPAEQFGIRWLAGYHECQWAGVRCAGVLLVVEIRLTANKINGPIPTELAKLSELRALSLWHNRLTGTLPLEITTELPLLQTLQLHENNLHGSLSPYHFNTNETSLAELTLGYNAFTGGIPAEIALLASSATTVDLRSNQFTGTLPTELFELSQLSELRLSGNKFTGSIPTELGNLDKLKHLEISDAFLSGSIPSEIGMLQGIQSLSLDNTNMNGNLPEELFTGALALQELRLNDCHFSGTISTQIGLLTGLQVLDLSKNDFDGMLPFEMESMSKLEVLRLNGNPNLSGEVPGPICVWEFQSITAPTMVADCAEPETGVQCGCCQCCNAETGVCD